MVARSTAPAAPEHLAERTGAARLAALTGGSLVNAPDGRTSVVFPSGGQQPGGPTRLARTATTDRALPGPVPAAGSIATGSIGAGSIATGSIDVDELYEQIAARLRRELLLDRERAGELP